MDDPTPRHTIPTATIIGSAFAGLVIWCLIFQVAATIWGSL